eukprot:11343739-Alexandrium_andersonii.AAC.1
MDSPYATREEAEAPAVPARPSCPPQHLGWPLPPPAAAPLPARVQEDVPVSYTHLRAHETSAHL